MRRRPLFWFTVAFAVGILLAGWAFALFGVVLVCLPVLTVLFALTKRRFWAGLALLAGVSLLGGLHYQAARLVAANDISRLAPAFVTVMGRVESDIDITRTEADSTQTHGIPQREQFTLQATKVEGGPLSAPVEVSGSVQVFLPLLSSNSDTNSSEKSGETLPHYGDILAIHGKLDFPSEKSNPDAFDYREMLARRGIYATLKPRRPEDAKETGEQTGSPILRTAFALRQAILKHGRDVFSPKQASVLNGLLLGAKADLPFDSRDAFERTGTMHILATAGLHIGILVWLLLTALRGLRVSRRFATGTTLFLLLLFALMAGGRPSVSRAVLVAVLILAGSLLNREPDWWNSTALAALLLLLYNPLWLFDPGFQLSFVTVITLVLLMPFFEGKLRRLHPKREDGESARLRDTILVYFGGVFVLSLAAQFATLPLFAYYQYEIPLVGIPANATVVPLVVPIFVLGFPAAFLAVVHPALAVPFDFVLRGLLNLLMGIVRWWASLPFGFIYIASPPVWLLWLYYGGLWYGLWRTLHRPAERRSGT